jgi:predicted N-acyltransferase
MIVNLQEKALSKPPSAVENGWPGSRNFLTIPFAEGVARVVSLADLQDINEWGNAFEGKCKDHRFYEIVEQTLESEWEHAYLHVEDLAGNVRAVQPLFFVRQNLVEGVPALRGAMDAIRRHFPRFLTMQVLMVGNAAGPGDLACAPEDEEWVAEALLATLGVYARQSKASLVVFKDFPANYRHALRTLSANGYTRVPSMPMTQLQLGHADFEQYLNTLGRSTRKDLRRKFRKITTAAPITLEVVTDITPQVDEVYPLYLQVHERSPLKFERLTKDFLCALGRRMPDRVRFFIWRQNGKIIAFSVTMVHDGTLYDDYLGLDYRVALDLHLYFYTLRDIMSWALAQGLVRYRSSPLNYKPKLHLNCDLFPLDLYVMHTTPLLNAVFRPALKYLEPTRHDSVLRQFRNAHELHGDAE